MPAANLPPAMRMFTTIPTSVARKLRFRRLVDMVSDQVAEHRVAEFRLEPRALGRHDAAGVRDGHQILDARREHRKGAGIIALIDQLFEFADAADAADEIDPLAGARVVDVEQRPEDVILEQRDVEFLDWIARTREL